MMDNTPASSPIVVGIDGPKYAIRAAIWAVDEAVRRDAALLLTCVINSDAKDLDREYAHARHVLHEAWSAAEATGNPVKLESVVLQGDPVAQLIKASRTAAMVCVGSKGTNNSRHHERGATAADLALAAFSPVAIIRRRHTHKAPPAGTWIVAALDRSPEVSTVLQTAMNEAMLRDTPILALTRWSTAGRPEGEPDSHHDVRAKLVKYLQEAGEDAADVEICTLPMSEHIANVLAQSADIDQLVIIGPDDPDLVAEAVGPHARNILRGTNCSVLVLRDRSQN